MEFISVFLEITYIYVLIVGSLVCNGVTGKMFRSNVEDIYIKNNTSVIVVAEI